jgi:restriction system protein
MPEITRRRTGELLRAVFEILQEYPDGIQAKDVLRSVVASMPLSDYESGEFESGGKRVDKIVRFATVDCVKAGWMTKQVGKWSITDAGKRAYARYPDPAEFYREAVKLYRVWKTSQPVDPDVLPDLERVADGVTEGKLAAVTVEQAQEEAWSEIEQYLRQMNPYDFQELVASLLRAMGYHVSWVSPPGKDGGIDILAWTDPLGTKPPRIKVQVKRIGQNVTVDELRSFMALLGDDDVGLFVTTSSFTKDAQEVARTQEKRKITLVDLERFFDLWVEYYGKLEDGARRRLPLQPIYFLAPERG